MITDKKVLLKALGPKTTDPVYDFSLFEPLPKPQHPDDWLSQYEESPQTFKQFTNDAPEM
jgi:hypothetical protein